VANGPNISRMLLVHKTGRIENNNEMNNYNKRKQKKTLLNIAVNYKICQTVYCRCRGLMAATNACIYMVLLHSVSEHQSKE